MTNITHIEDFFRFARERHAIYLRRQASLPAPWTADPILQQFSFTNVFRQLDKTTQWYTENVRKKLPPEQMLLATVVYRWFNRIRTGEAIFSLPAEGVTPWDVFWSNGDVNVLREVILEHCGAGPYVTGAYIIKTPDGYDKLSGVLKCIEWFMEGDWKEYNLTPESKPQPLENTWDWLRSHRFLGDFMAYEVVTDLRWCEWWNKAPDIMTWANPGPGATRGIGRVFHGDKDKYNQHRDKNSVLIPAMKILLDASRDPGLWPHRLPIVEAGCRYTRNCEYDERFQADGDWPAWEMRDVEHTLCEFDKHQRVLNGEGKPRNLFRSK